MGESKKKFKVDAQGSLGVLALGDIGVKLWKEQMKIVVERKAKEENKKNSDADGEKNS